MPKKYSSLQEIVDQLESCGYETSDQYHDLENNTAFIALKERAATEQGKCAKLQSGEAPVQQLKTAIALVRKEALSCKGIEDAKWDTFDRVLDTIEQRAAV